MAGRGIRRGDAAQEAADGEPGEPRTTAPARTITLPGEERSVASGRRFVRDTLGARHPGVETVALSVSELATNAIKHTHSGQITIGIVAVGALIRAEVTNDGTTASQLRVTRDEALAVAWGVVEHAGGTTVWAEFRF
jgi:anti-sigma regulatory factor (Ser/Thr protein kinase)